MRGLARALDRFIEAPDWRRSERILRRHPELLGREARRRLEEHAAAARRDGDDDDADTYLFYRNVLDRCREVGPERGIDEQAGLDALIDRAQRGNGDAAIDGFRRAAALTLPGDTRRPGVLSALGEALMRRFARFADADALEEAVSAFETAVAITDGREPAEHAVHLGNLAVALSEHLLHLDPADIHGAVDAYRQALRLTPAGAPELGQRQANLGTGLAERHASLGNPTTSSRRSRRCGRRSLRRRRALNCATAARTSRSPCAIATYCGASSRISTSRSLGDRQAPTFVAFALLVEEPPPSSTDEWPPPAPAS